MITRFITKWLYNLSNKLPCRVINLGSDQPYLERYYVGKFLGITFYLHRFVGGDGDRARHDHPWEAASLILSGGYQEARLSYLCPDDGTLTTTRSMGAGRLNLIRANKFHRIFDPKPNTWTLFMHGQRFKSWGFLEHFRHNCVMYQQPYDVTASLGWHKQAPSGYELRAEAIIQ